jgi:hypothetical protein
MQVWIDVSPRDAVPVYVEAAILINGAPQGAGVSRRESWIEGWLLHII